MLDHGGQVVVVTGEAGLGKSQLIQEFAFLGRRLARSAVLVVASMR